MAYWLIIVLAMGASGKALAQVLAQVGDAKITVQQYKDRLKEITSKGLDAPDASLFLEELVRAEVGLQEAKKQNLEKDPIFKLRYDQELYKLYLEKSLIADIEKIRVTEGEMKSFFKKKPEIRLSHILIEVKPKASAQDIATAKKRALEIYAEVKKSKRPFAELVKLYSDDAFTNKSGGDLGYHTENSLPPSLYSAALRLKKDEIGSPIQTRYGFHIIQKTDVQSYEDCDKVKLRAAVFDEKRKALFNNHFAQVKKKYKIRIDKAQLSQLQR